MLVEVKSDLLQTVIFAMFVVPMTTLRSQRKNNIMTL